MAGLEVHDGDHVFLGNVEFLGAVEGQTVSSIAGSVSVSEANAAILQAQVVTISIELDDIAADDKITPVEKLAAKQLWDAIVVEGTVTTGTIPVQATAFGVPDTDFDAAYAALDAYLNTTLAVFSDMTATTDVVRATWNSTWNTYYDERTQLLNAIAAKAKELADDAQSAAEAAQGTADAKPEVYIQASQPADVPDGTIWFDSDDGNHPYVIIDNTPTDATVLQIGAIATAMLADGAVTLPKIPDGELTAAKVDMSAWMQLNQTGVMAYWSLNDAGLDASTFVHKDNSGRGHDLTATSRPTAVEGPAGPCADLTDQQFSTPDHADLQFGTGEFFVCGWVQFDTADISTVEYLFDKRAASSYQGFLANRQAADERILFYVPLVVGTSWRIIYSDAGITDTSAYHFFVFQRKAGYMEMYIDAVKQADTKTSTTTVSGATYNLQLGGNVVGANRLNGKMAHWRMGNRGLSLAEIQWLYANPSGNVPAMLLAHRAAFGSLTSEVLNVLAKDLVNNVSKSGHLGGWGLHDDFGGDVAGTSNISLVDGTYGGLSVKAMRITADANWGVRSKAWEVDHDLIYKVTVVAKRTAGSSAKFYFGMRAVTTTLRNASESSSAQSGTEDVERWTAPSGSRAVDYTGTNVYFIAGVTPTTETVYTSYIVGANRSVDECPAVINCGNIAKLKATTTHVALRVLRWDAEAGAAYDVIFPTVQRLGAGTIVAENVDVAGLITAGSLIVSGDDVSDLNNDSGYQIASDVSSAISAFAGTLGDLALEDVVGLALLDETVIDGGLILTSLLDADAIIAEVAVIDAAFIALLQAVNILFTKAVGSQSKATPAEGDERAYLGKDPTGSQTETDPVEIAFKNYVSSVWETLYRVAFKTIESDIKVAVMKLVGRAGIGGDEDDYHALKVHGDTLVDGLVRESYHDYVQLEKPDDFVWTPPVTIHTDGKRNYSHDFDIEDYRPSLAGTTYYVDPDGDDGNTGLTRDDPFATIGAALDEGDAARIILKGGTYLYGTLDGYPDGIAQDLILEAHPGEVATISMHKEYSWTKTGGYTNVYHVSESEPISAWCFDAGVIDAYGNYRQLEVAAGVSACDATPGSFYHNTGTNVLYVHTADSRAADADLRLFISTTNLAVTGPYELFLKNVIFEGGDTGALRLNDDAGGSPDLYAFRCQFNYSSDGAGGLDCRGAGTVFLHRCRAIHNNQDGFNYHEALTDDTRVLEIECVGTDNGEASADNDQGSTLHDGLVGVRINGLYIRNWGQGVADITAGTQAWNIGCVAGDSVTTVDEELNASWCAFVGAEMWLVGCRAYGSKYDIRVEDTSIVYVTNCELQRAAKIVDSGIIKRFDFREETGDHSAGVPYNFQVPGTIYPQRGLILNSFLATDSASAGEVYNAFDATIYDVILARTHAQGSIDLADGGGWRTVYMITRYDSSTFRVYYNGGYVAVTVAATGGKWYLSW